MKRRLVLGVVLFIAGVITGGILFSDTQPRSLLTAPKCQDCLSPTGFLGLVGSVAVLKTPGLIPNKVIETDLTLGIEHPRPSYPKHYVFVPKKDIRAVGELAEGEQDYLIDIFTAIATVVNKNNMTNYRIWTNGPDNQAVTYMHFHLGGQ